MTQRNPFAPPHAEIHDARLLPTKGPLATRPLRLAGAVVDGVALVVFVVPILVFTSYRTGAFFGWLTYGAIALASFTLFTATRAIC